MRRRGPMMLALLLVVAICAIGLPIHAARMPVFMGEMAGPTDPFVAPDAGTPGATPCCLAEVLPAARTPVLPLTAALALIMGLVMAWAPPGLLGLLARAERWQPPVRPRFTLFHAYLI